MTILQLNSVRHWAPGLLDDPREPWWPLAKVLAVDMCPRLKLPWLRVSIVDSLLLLLVCSDCLAGVRHVLSCLLSITSAGDCPVVVWGVVQ